MSIHLTDEHRRRIEEFRARHKTGVLTLLFTDMVGSTELKRVLGDAGGTALIELQQQVVRQELARYEEAEEISTAGDSFFITFIRPSDAVRFALNVHHKLRFFSKNSPFPVLLRTGIHMGEVFIDTGGTATRKRDILGIQVDAASRVMLLASGGQTLMTRSVFDNARAVLRGEELENLRTLAWLNHGYFKAAGVEEPFEVCEVGEEGLAPLSPPPSRGKVQRFMVPNLEPVVGWHPALDIEVPTAHGWVLREKVGEGGFGEVWRGTHKTLKEDRIFKFCFHADRARSLKREVALFRLLRDKVGDHPNIVRIHDVYFDSPPYYLVMEHIHGLDLLRWCDREGGIAALPFETRIRIVIQVAEALEAAHQSGVIHRDVKPTNILINGNGRDPQAVKVWLTDFGIGEVIPGQFDGNLITSGLTEVGFQSEMSSRTGTRVYMAPEILAGRASTVQSDVFSLGVVLFQLVIGDFAQPVTTDWDRMVEDPVIREDIAKCFAGDPSRRFANAAELATRLRSLEGRRVERERLEKETREAELKAREEAQARQEESRREIYQSSILRAAQCIQERRYWEARDLLSGCPHEHRHFEWGRLTYLCHLDRATLSLHQGPIVCLALSPDGKTLASGSEDRTVRLWDTRTGEPIFCLDGQADRVDSLAFHPDGDLLAVGTGDGGLALWDAETGKRIRCFEGHKGLIDSLAFSPDGQKLASGSWDNTVRIWKVATGLPLGTFEARSSARVGFDSAGRCLGLVCTNGEAWIWDVETKQQVALLPSRFPVFGILAAAFSPDGSRLVTGDRDGTARIWDTQTGSLVKHVKGHYDTLRAVALDAANEYLLSGSSDRTARVWNLAGELKFLELRGHGDGINCVALGPDPSLVVTGSSDGQIKIWDGVQEQSHLPFIGHESNLWQVAYSPDGHRLATCSGESVWEEQADNTARLWNVSTGEPIQVLEGHDSNVWSVAFHPRKDLLLTGSADRTARVWELATGETLRRLEGHQGFILAVAFSPDGEYAVTAGRDNRVRIWNWEEEQVIATLDRHTAPIGALAFDPTGEYLATGSWDMTTKLWKVDSWQEVRTLSGSSGHVDAVAFSPNGRILATGGKDNQVRFWEVATGTQLPPYFEASSSITAIDFSPDGGRMVTGCGDHTAKIWDTQTGKALLSLTGHRWFVVSAVFSPDGRAVVTGSSDHTAILWPTFPWVESEVAGEEKLTPGEGLEGYKRDFRAGLPWKVIGQPVGKPTV